MEMKNKIIDYMESCGIDAKKVSDETGVSLRRLTRQSDADIDADDLCKLCTYLSVKPEDFYVRKMTARESLNIQK